jgi:hypothetical protein
MRPHALAGMRIEPPLSLPCAIGTIPAATLAADPPLEPPAVVSRFQGLQVALVNADSVEIPRANSGVVVRPSKVKPAFLKKVR